MEQSKESKDEVGQMMENTIIRCYGSLRKRQGEIFDSFDWSGILENIPDSTRNEHNHSILTVNSEGEFLANISASGRQISIHPGTSYVVDQVMKLMETAVSEVYDCRCVISRNHKEYGFVVSMYIPETRSYCGITCGDILTFGSFSSSPEAEKEPVSWRVLDICEGYAWLIADQTLIRSGYCDKEKGYNNKWYLKWGNSLTREMCNGFFYHYAFDHNEKGCIVPQKIEEAEFGPVCTDEVFILSESQACLFFPEEAGRRAMASQNLKKLEALSSEHKLNTGYSADEKYVSWWLLPEEEPMGEIYPKAVLPDGEIRFHGRFGYHTDFTIRPCICVRLSEDFLSCIGKDSTESEAAPFTKVIGEKAPEKAPVKPNSESIQMEPSRLFFMTFFDIDNADKWRCSFDFEKADDSHYQINLQEAEKLVSFLQSRTGSNEKSLSVLVATFLGNTLHTPEKLESAIVYMLKCADVSYKQFHFY